MKKAIALTTAVFVAVVILTGGCATTKGPTDQEMILGVLQTMKAGLEAGNVEQVGSVIAEDFYHDEAGDKATLLDFLQAGIDSGYTENGEVDLTQVQITIEGDTATAYPIPASSSAGSATAELQLKKQDGKWLVIGGDADV